MRAKRKSMEEQYRLVMECRQSGLSDHNWCLEHDIRPGTFYNWIRRLRKKGTYVIPDVAGRETYKASPRQDVVKVELVQDPVVQIPKPAVLTDKTPASRFEHSLELHLGKASVFVSNDIDPVLLARTIQILEGSLSC